MYAVCLDLSKYFDTLNHELLMNMLREDIKNKRLIDFMLYKVKVFMRGWLGYYGIADMKKDMERWNEWLRRRIRMYIWKQWKLPGTSAENLKKLGMPDWQAYRNGNTRKGYWAVAGSGILTPSNSFPCSSTTMMFFSMGISPLS